MLMNLKDRWRLVAVVVFLVLCAALPYANTLLNGFVYDDTSQILENPYIRSFRYLRQIFTTSVFSYLGMPSRYYRPMMTFGYLLCYKVFGFQPAGFHLVNVALHAAIVCMVFGVTLRMFRERLPAFVAAVIFALHPIHTESVAWIAAVTDLELTFFYVLAFWFFLAIGSAAGKKAILAYVGMGVSFALALISKEQAVTLPLLAMIYEHFYREDRLQTSWPQKLKRYMPLWFLVAAYIPLRLSSLGGFVVYPNFTDMTHYQVFLSAIALTGQYMGKLFWPADLNAFYVFHRSTSLLEPPVLAGVFCGLVLCAIFVYLWKRARLVSFGMIWLLVPLAPVLIPKWVGLNVFTERYLYLPSVGFCWIMAWAFQRIWKGLAARPAVYRGAFVSSLGLLALLCALRIVTRNRDWQDNITLYTRTLESSPDATLIRINLGTNYKTQGLIKQAEFEFRETLERDPRCAECLNDLGLIYMEQSRDAEAKEFLIRAIRLDPKAVWARLNLGLIYQRTGFMDLAEQQFSTAAKHAAGDVRVHLTVGLFYQQQHQPGRAEAAFQRALDIDPYHQQSRIALAQFYESEHRPTEAIRQYQVALENDPGLYEATVALRRLNERGN